MMREVPPRLQQLLALMILLVLVGGIWSVVVQPLLRSWQLNREQMAQDIRLLTAYRRVAAAQHSFEVRLQQLQRGATTQNGFLVGDNAELVGASLQSELRSIIESAGGEIVSAQILPAVSESGFRKIAVQVQFKIGTTGLPKAAYSIESRQPVLLIDNASIRAPESIAPSTANADPRELAVSWEVYGYMRGAQP